jgi:hypothetical protein
MAEFCLQCNGDMFGHEVKNDFVGLSTPDDTLKGLFALVLCEGCGPCQVDHTGRCISNDCLEKHGLIPCP